MEQEAPHFNEIASVTLPTMFTSAISEPAFERLGVIAATALGLQVILMAIDTPEGEQLSICHGMPWPESTTLSAASTLGSALLPTSTALMVDPLHPCPPLQTHPLLGELATYLVLAIHTTSQQRRGTIVFGDRVPRELSLEQQQLCAAFAEQAAALVLLRAEQSRVAELEAIVQEAQQRTNILLDTLERQRNQAEIVLLQGEASISALLDALPDMMFRLNREGRFLDYRAPHGSLLFALPEQFLGRLIEEVLPDSMARQTRYYVEQARTLNAPQFFEYQISFSEGKSGDFEARIVPLDNDETLAIVRDITERKRLEAQVLQIQKIESVGQLAGGIAHDFNNLLTAIIGYAELASLSLDPDSNAADDVEEIHRAAERAAGLTRQLLSFARWQVMELRNVRLNELIFDLYKLLRRLIGEDIELIILPAYQDLWVKIDPGQIEQVLVNLAINARDAMPEGGKLTIAVGQRTLSEEQARKVVGMVPGDYVLLSVTDTGIGMNDHVKAHLFEPFFTTKEKGRGTGLGLATCYGIIKQHGGTIEIDSQVEVGTTLEIYLPQIHGEAGASYSLLDEARGLPRGNETILLVEDEPAVRVLAARVLRAQGYIVLEAENGDDALSIARQRGRAVLHLLLTDVVMPRMSGKTLAERVTAMLPDVKVLFTSGYTSDIMIYQGPAGTGLAFLQKPFTPVTLARKVREVLDS